MRGANIFVGSKMPLAYSEVSALWDFDTNHALWPCTVSLAHVSVIKITPTTLRPSSLLQQHHVNLLELKNSCDFAPTLSFFFANTCFYLKWSGSCWNKKQNISEKKNMLGEKKNLIPCPGSRFLEPTLENTVSSLGKGIFLSLSSFSCLTAHFFSSSQDIFHVASLLKIHLHLQSQKKTKTKKNTYDLHLVGFYVNNMQKSSTGS